MKGSRKTKRSKWLKPRYSLEWIVITYLVFSLLKLDPNFPDNPISRPLLTYDNISEKEVQAVIISASEQKLTHLITENKYLKTKDHL